MPNFIVRSLRWLGSHELAVLLAVAGIAAGVWAFALLSDEVMEGGMQAFDRKILLAMLWSLKGLLLLIATPVARVIFSAIVFAMEGDRMYLLFTLIVLAVLLYSLFGAFLIA